MVTAFMEGVHAGRKGKSVKDTPYADEKMLLLSDPFAARLWAEGLVFGLEQCVKSIES